MTFFVFRIKTFPFCFSKMDDAHLWELAQRIATQQELLDLGLKVLGLPQHQVTLALTNMRDVDLAAYHILQTWCKQYTSSLEAYTVLYTSLKKYGKNQLAAQLQELVSPGATSAPTGTSVVKPYSSTGATSFSKKGQLILLHFSFFLYREPIRRMRVLISHNHLLLSQLGMGDTKKVSITCCATSSNWIQLIHRIYRFQSRI